MLLRIKGFLAQMWTETIQERGGQVDREYSSACTHFLTDIDTGLDCTKAKKDGKVSVEITCNGPPSYACANEHRCNAPPHIRHPPVGRSRDRRSVLYRFMLNCVRIAFQITFQQVLATPFWLNDVLVRSELFVPTLVSN